MKHIILLVFLIASLFGCATQRDTLARWIGPDEADYVVAWTKTLEDKIKLAATDEGANLRLQKEIDEILARLNLAEVRANLMEEIEKEKRLAEIEVAKLVLQEALKGIN